MPEPLKNLIGETVVRETAAALARAWPEFDRQAFLAEILPDFDNLELMQRSQSVAAAMTRLLPQDFARSASILRDCLPDNNRPGLSGWALLAFNQYIGANGLAHFETSLDLLKAITPHFTAEFGIRPFIAAERQRALAIITGWISDPNHHVRRLASEGTRPRLPWAMRLPELIRDPSPLMPILIPLLDDPEDYVRRSVANSLNDIAKDHPDLVADFVARHRQDASAERLWLLRHASRTLVKKGHAGVLASFGFETAEGIKAGLSLKQTTIAFPGTLEFAVRLSNGSDKAQRLLIDYAIHHRKKDGSLSPKVFKGTSLTIGPDEAADLDRRHAFRPITTRVYYPGLHRLELLVNGSPLASAEFHLDMKEDR
ncbi:DNA alkylation repair protein [Rhizobium cremeum]|uniref:DNA alkylation repair protein n=1 Tax=Rhizobium cremeum TaxID=2813827 RepID=UPI000DDFB82F|nr:DNA alkylation repair protein [Rhizobium cremeum]MCJ7993655.1 DNA alkylation repair protein [Rhizobium cremeum]MCJ7998712.1 DNA alkylation repair protein [Rhizobium cremeum]